MKKITMVAMIILSLSAIGCTGGGSSSSTPITGMKMGDGLK